MKSDLDLELGSEQRQIIVLSQSIDSILERLDKVEKIERPVLENSSTSVACTLNKDPLNENMKMKIFLKSPMI